MLRLATAVKHVVASSVHSACLLSHLLPTRSLICRRTASACTRHASLCGGTTATLTRCTCRWICPRCRASRSAALATSRWTARACCCGPWSSWRAQTLRGTRCGSCVPARCGRCTCARGGVRCRCAVRLGAALPAAQCACRRCGSHLHAHTCMLTHAVHAQPGRLHAQGAEGARQHVQHRGARAAGPAGRVRSGPGSHEGGAAQAARLRAHSKRAWPPARPQPPAAPAHA